MKTRAHCEDIITVGKGEGVDRLLTSDTVKIWPKDRLFVKSSKDSMG
jgi:hypothetical protein